jgi:hypothetical protein
MIRRIREVLGLQADPGSSPVVLPGVTELVVIQEIACIKLQTRLSSGHCEGAATSSIAQVSDVP